MTASRNQDNDTERTVITPDTITFLQSAAVGQTLDLNFLLSKLNQIPPPPQDNRRHMMRDADTGVQWLPMAADQATGQSSLWLKHNNYQQQQSRQEVIVMHGGHIKHNSHSWDWKSCPESRPVSKQ